MPPTGSTSKTPKQQRSFATKERLAEATIQLLGEVGEAGVTHRAVAERGNVSLASTTYYYDSKDSLLADASASLLTNYVDRFHQFAARQLAQVEGRVSVQAFFARLLRRATGKDRLLTIAWCEIMLACARHAQTRALARTWYANLQEIWTEIFAVLGASTDPLDVQTAIDRTVGLLFIMVPLGLPPEQAEAALTAGLDPALIDSLPLAPPIAPATESRKARETRQQLLDAAKRIMATHGAAAVTGRAVAAEAGLAPGTPANYFKPISTLLDAAREQLYEAAKARYREGVSEIDPRSMSFEQMVDLSAAVLVREVTQYSELNIATLSVEVEAARQPAHRSMVGKWFIDRTRGWLRLLSHTDVRTQPADALMACALYNGIAIRLLSTGADSLAIAQVRSEFWRALQPHPQVDHPGVS
ncbi:TetR/AcrR family transcriptional regulator [Trinickia sp.]|uniref:TetR/AcrR family transcriptional regulator n=1 Tax=Trinickia sp. TaxID=2571163 RepID=UPI003F7E4BB7